MAATFLDSTRRHAWPIRLLLAGLAVILVATVGIVAATLAKAAEPLLVNSLNQGPDVNPGDGMCETATAGECTLRAAIQEANADPGADRIEVDPGFAGGNIDVTGNTSTWMTTTSPVATSNNESGVGGADWGDGGGAVYVVTAPVTIDMDHKITASTASNIDVGVALFFIDGPDVTITGLDNSYAGETTFYVGPKAVNVTLTDGVVSTPNYYPERLLLVRGGATNVTLSHYQVSGFAADAGGYGWTIVDATSAAKPVNGLTLQDNLYHSTVNESGASACNGDTANGCNTSVLRAVDDYVNDLVIDGNTYYHLNHNVAYQGRFLNLRGTTSQAVNNPVAVSITNNELSEPILVVDKALIDFGDSGDSANVSSFEITGNKFTDVTAQQQDMNGLIRLPAQRTVTSGLIADNVFTAGDARMQAIYWQGNTRANDLSTFDSHVVIRDNYFDGWGDDASRPTIRLYQTGAVTVQGNTFGTATTTQTDTTQEESNNSTIGGYIRTMLSNFNLSSNGKMNTWFPTARTSADQQPGGPIQPVGCTIPLAVAPPSDPSNLDDIATARYPVVTPKPVTLDVYWTATNTAEVFLGSYQVSDDAPTTLQVPLPTDPDDPAFAKLPAGSVLPVDADGVVHGGLRLQTQDPNANPDGTVVSSQYSRVATIGGSCAPKLTINQADDQADSTMTRDIHFTLTTAVPIDPATLTPDDISLDGSTAPDARIVSITPSSDGLSFDIVARADDSGTISVSVPANAVTTTTGLTNGDAASSTDAQVTYTNPLSVSPPTFPLVIGDSAGQDYSIEVSQAAPPPTAELSFSTVFDQTGQDYQLTLTPGTPTIPVGDSIVSVNVTAPNGTVTADTPALITHQVESADSNYDGLHVPSVSPHLFSTNPEVSIVKSVYTGVTGPNTPENIVATGTPAAYDGHLNDSTPVWFVFTVTNTSKDDWATSLTNIVVTDDVLGEIGTIPTLASGDSASLVYARNPVPIRANGPAPQAGE